MTFSGLCRTLLGIACIVGSQSAWSILAINDKYIIPQDAQAVTIDPLTNDIIDINSLQTFTNADFQLQFGLGSIDTSDGVLVTPAPGFTGQLVFTYRITDATGTDQGAITIEVQASPAPHQAVDDFHHVLQDDVAIFFDVLANDNFNFSNTQISATSTPVNGGTVTIDPQTALSLSYQPAAGFTGVDTFTYDLLDLQTSVISQATVTVFVGFDPNLNPRLSGASDEEQGTIDIIDQICADAPNSPLPCALIATLTDAQKRSLAQQVGGRHAKAQSRAVRQIKNRQSTNVRSRLSEIRGQRNQVSVNNLNTVVFNEAVPLGKAFQPLINNTLSGGSAGDGDITTPWGFFINGNVSFGEGTGDNDRPQYDQDGFNITSGADYRLNERLVIGGALGYSQSNFDFSFNRGTQNSDSYTLSVFGNYYPTNNVYVDFLAMWVNADIDIDRRINIATFSQSVTSSTSSQQTVAATSFGYEFNVQAWQGSLYARAEYSDLTIDAYTESGSGAFELQVGEQQSDSLDFAFGGRVAYAYPLRRGILLPSLEVESVSQGDEDYAIESRFAQVPSAQRIAVDAQEQDTNYYNASLSLSAVWSGGRSGFVRYETVIGHDEYESDSYSLGFRIEF